MPCIVELMGDESVGPVHLVEVDCVHAQTSEATVGSAHNAGAPGVPRSDLRGNDCLGSPIAQRVPEDLLRPTVAVILRSVEEVDAKVESALDD